MSLLRDVLNYRIRPSIFVLVFSALFLGRSQAQTSVFVIPTQPWTDTGISVTAGQALAITATGELDYNTNNTCPSGQTCTVGPNGSGNICTGYPVVAPNLICNSLIGQIANGTPFQVGSSLNLASVPATGELYLGVNDSYFADNTLGWTAFVTATCTEVVGSSAQSTCSKAPSLLTLAKLSDNIYAGNNGYEMFSFIGNNCTLPPNTCGDFAFAAGAYANQDDSQIVIAIRGTVIDGEPFQNTDAFIESVLDVLIDLSFGGDQTNFFLSTEVRDAAQFVQQVQARYPNAHVTLTGHSLGGAIAQLLSAASGLSAYVFNAPGAETVYAALVTAGNLDGFSVVNNPSYISVNYRLYGEQISLLGQSFGTSITLSDPPDIVLTTDATSSCLDIIKEGATFATLHGIGLMVTRIADNAPQVSSLGEPNIATACHLP